MNLNYFTSDIFIDFYNRIAAFKMPWGSKSEWKIISKVRYCNLHENGTWSWGVIIHFFHNSFFPSSMNRWVKHWVFALISQLHRKLLNVDQLNCPSSTNQDLCYRSERAQVVERKRKRTRERNEKGREERYIYIEREEISIGMTRCLYVLFNPY